jgi:tetratricopeptide (TPR) repeat protein
MARSQKHKKKSSAGVKTVAVQESKAPSTKEARREQAIGRSHFHKQEWLLIGIVLAITFVIFMNALDGQFVYDDRQQILKNPTLTSFANIPKMFTQGVWQFLNQTDKLAVGPYYRPLFNIALIINHQFFGLQVYGWHLFSILLHLGVVLLIFRVARQWGLTREVAAAAALLFGLHPVHSESVAWVAALPDPLAALFILASLLFYERYHHGQAKKPWALGLSIGLALAAMFSKEVAVIFPLFLVVREAIARLPEESFRSVFVRTAKRTAPFFALIIVYLAMRYTVLGFLRQDEPNAVNIPTTQVLMTIPSILLSYVRMLCIPYRLAVMYGNQYVQSAADPHFWAATLGMLMVVAAAIEGVARSAVARRALALMVIFILPVLNLKAFRPEESLLHDRYLYLPSIGFCILIAMALGWLSERFAARQKPVLVTVTALIALVFAVLTFNQNLTWQSEKAMTDNALRVTPDWPFLYNYIGAYAMEQNQLPEAERAFREAIERNPKYYDAYSNLGDIQRTQGSLADAEQSYLKAIDYGAPYGDTRYNLGVTYISLNRLEDAEHALQQAIEIQPSLINAHYNLAWVYDHEGKNNQAKQEYQATIELKPDYAEPRINLGAMLGREGQYPDALKQLQAAQAYAPDHPILLYSLGDVYQRLARYDEAITAYNQVLRREPQHGLAYTGLGLCYEAKGNKEQAKVNFQKAIDVASSQMPATVAREHLAKL